MAHTPPQLGQSAIPRGKGGMRSVRNTVRPARLDTLCTCQCHLGRRFLASTVPAGVVNDSPLRTIRWPQVSMHLACGMGSSSRNTRERTPSRRS
eukprot:5214882-Prymnesium_polylepis.1